MKVGEESRRANDEFDMGRGVRLRGALDEQLPLLDTNQPLKRSCEEGRRGRRLEPVVVHRDDLRFADPHLEQDRLVAHPQVQRILVPDELRDILEVPQHPELGDRNEAHRQTPRRARLGDPVELLVEHVVVTVRIDAQLFRPLATILRVAKPLLGIVLAVFCTLLGGLHRFLGGHRRLLLGLWQRLSARRGGLALRLALGFTRLLLRLLLLVLGVLLLHILREVLRLASRPFDQARDAARDPLRSFDRILDRMLGRPVLLGCRGLERLGERLRSRNLLELHDRVNLHQTLAELEVALGLEQPVLGLDDVVVHVAVVLDTVAHPVVLALQELSRRRVRGAEQDRWLLEGSLGRRAAGCQKESQNRQYRSSHSRFSSAAPAATPSGHPPGARTRLPILLGLVLTPLP